jgi:hypothetical protein
MINTIKNLPASLLIFILLCQIVGIIFFASFLSDKINEQLVSPHATGFITKSEIVYSSNRDSIETYSLDIEYFYKIDGAGYKNNKYYYRSRPQKTRSALRKLIKEKYALGQQVVVYYNPGSPANGFLVRKVDTFWWKIPVMLVLCAIMFLMLPFLYGLIYVEKFSHYLFLIFAVTFFMLIFIFFVNYLLD